MKSNKLFILLLLLAVISGCGGGGGGGGSTTTTKTLVSIAVTPANPSIATGTNEQFTATGTYSDSTTQDLTTSVTWTSSNTGVATIAADGLATATNTAGSTTITAASGGVSGTTTLTVTAATLVSIAVTPANPSIASGTTQQFTATGTYSNSSTQNISTSVTWTSSSTGVATIAAGGLATATNTAGSTTITAASGGVSGTTTLTVTAATLVSIAVTPANPSIASGTTQQFTATGTYSNSATQNITTSVTWTSSSTGVATIAAGGLATATATGSTTIMAALGGVSGTTTLTVTAATLVSIAVTPVNPSIDTGTTQQFTATGKYSNSATQNITTSVTWTSSSTGVATIAANGLATATSVAGSTTITAALGGVSGTTTLFVVAVESAGANVVPITVNGSLCSSATLYPNKPCVSVTICTHGTTTCVTVNDILLDTGSYGLRIFSTTLTGVSLTQVTSPSGGDLTNCAEFLAASSLWGPVMTADVKLGGEAAVQMPIQVINSSFGNPGNNCETPAASPTDAEFNGILGVGLLAQDCGSTCTTSANNGVYYSCTGTTCTGSTAPIASQVINPVAALPTGGDNNGVIVELQSVALGGVPSVNGNLILGIGTQTNNQPPSTVTAYPADPTNVEFTTSFDGKTFSESFIDSGSNGLFFYAPTSLIPQCSSNSSGSGYFCPSSTTEYSATNSGYSGSPTGTVGFEIGNATTLFGNASNNVFIELGADVSERDDYFDWGLPFFFGRPVYVGIEGKSSSLGTGPYWAY